MPSFKNDNGHIAYYVEAIIDKKLVTDFFYKTRAEFNVKISSNINPPAVYEVSNNLYQGYQPSRFCLDSPEFKKLTIYD